MSDMPTLQECREKIDLLDRELTCLLKQRMQVSENVARCKAATGKAVRDPAREQAILQKIAGNAGPEFRTELLALYSTLFSLSRARQKRLLRKEPGVLIREIRNGMTEKPESPAVACSSVHFPAAERFFSRPDCRESSDPEDAVRKGDCAFGILPEENFSGSLKIAAALKTEKGRLLCVSGKTAVFTGADRIRLNLELPHQPGELSRLLDRFAALELNLLEIVSRPLPDDRAGFLLEFQGSIRQPEVLELLDTLEGDAENVTLLGIYGELKP